MGRRSLARSPAHQVATIRRIMIIIRVECEAVFLAAPGNAGWLDGWYNIYNQKLDRLQFEYGPSDGWNSVSSDSTLGCGTHWDSAAIAFSSQIMLVVAVELEFPLEIIS